MHRESMLNKLYAWRKIEYLTPHQIHSKEISHRLMKEEDVPWVYNNQPDLIKMNNNTIHIVYLGVFKIQEIIKVIKEYLTDDKYVPEESNERTAFAEIKVTHAGQYVEGSFSLSTVPFGIGLFIQKGDAVFYESDWKSEFEEKHDKMVGYVETVLKSGVTVEHLHKIIDKMVDLMGWQPFKSKTIWSKASKSRHHARSGKKETPLKSTSKSDDEIGILNSFYIQDLEKVIDAVHRGDMGQGLARYLSGNKMTAESRIDVDLNQSFLTETLSPSEIPLARWPDKDTHTLNLMQQVAVNLALQERTPNNRLFSINGPPGTGKTTLLREIIANNVVNRASKLIQFSNPNNAFKKVKTITLSSGYSIHISQLDQALCGYSMVVASSNNNAVENVSAELPGLKSIAESYRDHPGADYFRGVATNLFASDSWGLISAPLGNSQNRKTFIDKCWFGNNPNTLKNILYTRNVTIHDWKKACRRFEEALTEVNNEKQKVIKLQQQVNRLQEVRENIKKKEKQLALLLRDERLSLET